MKITLSNGSTMLVDEDQFFFNLVTCSLTKDGYVVYIEGRKYYLVHRRILNVLTTKEIVDHINGDKLDNRRINLRIVTPSENSYNRSTPMNNKSGVCGVRWRSDRQKYQAYVGISGRQKSLGHFNTLEEAASKRKEYMNLNQIVERNT